MPTVSQIKAAVRIAAGRVRHDFVHVTVVDRARSRGFGLIGSRRPRFPFSRMYLGAREDTIVRPGLHCGGSASVARSLSRKYGLAILSDVKIDAGLDRELIHMPAWIGLSRDLPDSLKTLRAGLSTSAKSDVSKVVNRGFTYEVATDDSWVPEFHRRFHATGITSRHGDEGIVLSPGQLREEWRRPGGEFLKVFKDGEWVAGLLARHESQGYRLCRLGWRDGDPELHKAGALSAVYWFGFDRGILLGAKRLNFGGTPPFLDAGLTFFKGKWGGVCDPAEDWYGRQSLRIEPSHPHCQEFFAQRALVAFGNDGKSFVVLSGLRPRDLKIPANAYSTVSHWYRLLPEPKPEGSIPLPALPGHVQPWFAEEFITGQVASAAGLLSTQG